MTIAVSAGFVTAFNAGFALVFATCGGIVIWVLVKTLIDLAVLMTPEARTRLGGRTHDQARLWRLGTIAMESTTLTALIVFLVVGLHGSGPPRNAVPLWALVQQFALEFAILLLAARSAIFQYVLNRVCKVR